MDGRLLRTVLPVLLAALCPVFVLAQSVTPLNTVSIGVTLPPDRTLNATDSPITIPLATGTDTTKFNVANVIKVDSEYFSIAAVAPSAHDNPAIPGFTGYSTLTASRAQLGSTAAAHAASAAILRVYQLDVLLASPNADIGAYQLNVNYDSAKLSVVTVNVFPGTGALGNPVAVNTTTPGVMIVNSFNATAAFKGTATPVARMYFTGKVSGTANVSVTLTDLADALGSDLVSVPAGTATTLGAQSLTVTAFNVLKKVHGQITSQ